MPTKTHMRNAQGQFVPEPSPASPVALPTGQNGPATAPAPAPADLFAGMVGLHEEIVRRDAIPIFPGTMVFYLGGQDNHALSRPGQIALTPRQELDGTKSFLKTATEEGHYPYDFAIRDTQGDILWQRLGPDTLTGEKAHLRGRPWTYCEHAEHLRYFFLMRNPNDPQRRPLYYVLLRPEHQSAFQDYVQRTTQRFRRRERDIHEITTA